MLAILAGCESPAAPAVTIDPPITTPPVVATPANIIITSVAWPNVTFANRGGRGVFKMESWGHSSSLACIYVNGVAACPTLIKLGESEGVEVAAGWTETGRYSVPGGYRARRLIVYSRDVGSIIWRETHRETLPDVL